MHIPNPQDPSVERWCAGTHDSVTGVHLSPAGGERMGSSTIVSGSREELPSLDAAFLALWKASYCLVEEIPYEANENPRYAPLMTTGYRKFYDFVAGQPQIDDGDEVARTKFLSWLSGRTHEVWEAQDTLRPLLNAPFFLSPDSTLGPLDPRKEPYLAGDKLRLLVSDKWNATLGLFATAGRWYLVGWDTSA